MSWTPLGERFTALPLILSGPLLLFICYNNLGEIHFKWTAEKKVVMQRLWYYTDDPAQLLLKTDYHDTLELPAPNAAPPLP